MTQPTEDQQASLEDDTAAEPTGATSGEAADGGTAEQADVTELDSERLDSEQPDLEQPDLEQPDLEQPQAGRASAGSPATADLERESEIAADYLEELLDIADLDGDIDMDVERDRALVSIVGGDLDHLVGRDGVVLEALQELTRLAVHTQTGSRSRLMLDIGGYRAGRRAVLTELGRTTAEQVRETGEKVRLEPMSPFERKIVHDAVAAAGLSSESEGEEPRRRVVVLPA